MGMFDVFTGTKRPSDDTPVRSPGEVYNSILAINRPKAPFVIREGRGGVAFGKL